MALLFVAAGIGGFRGMRLVHWSLVIPEYIPLERLAAAFGLLFTLNGICLFIGGPILGKVKHSHFNKLRIFLRIPGKIRDISGNYKIVIILLNSITLTTIAMWTLEWIYRKIKLQKNSKTRTVFE